MYHKLETPEMAQKMQSFNLFPVPLSEPGIQGWYWDLGQGLCQGHLYCKQLHTTPSSTAGKGRGEGRTGRKTQKLRPACN